MMPLWHQSPSGSTEVPVRAATKAASYSNATYWHINAKCLVDQALCYHPLSAMLTRTTGCLHSIYVGRIKAQWCETIGPYQPVTPRLPTGKGNGENGVSISQSHIEDRNQSQRPAASPPAVPHASRGIAMINRARGPCVISCSLQPDTTLDTSLRWGLRFLQMQYPREPPLLFLSVLRSGQRAEIAPDLHATAAEKRDSFDRLLRRWYRPRAFHLSWNSEHKDLLKS
ncbi:hypothetical protein E1301_Tti003139 [Triplophysa tibetana]|uniref:Uncharacterized protein n=1 Tax=Triplophysa tibetana TaxID=1572043 RepID=A0A5A9PRV9_9TELE|nr:hypothetical protein E1301_Tti003139 [Triplophysa tibetana]